jgi:hypothetical protein
MFETTKVMIIIEFLNKLATIFASLKRKQYFCGLNSLRVSQAKGKFLSTPGNNL